MRAHHINAATLCPRSARLVNGRGPWLGRARMICHVLVVETARGVFEYPRDWFAGDNDQKGIVTALNRRLGRLA